MNKIKKINLRVESSPWHWSTRPCDLQRAAGQKATVVPFGRPSLAGEIGRAGPLSQRGVSSPRMVTTS
jgi:hypothetical protein